MQPRNNFYMKTFGTVNHAANHHIYTGRSSTFARFDFSFPQYSLSLWFPSINVNTITCSSLLNCWVAVDCRPHILLSLLDFIAPLFWSFFYFFRHVFIQWMCHKSDRVTKAFICTFLLGVLITYLSKHLCVQGPVRMSP